MQKVKAEYDELLISKTELTRELKNKEHELEEEIVKLNNKIRVQQSEIERLNEIISKR